MSLPISRSRGRSCANSLSSCNTVRTGVEEQPPGDRGPFHGAELAQRRLDARHIRPDADHREASLPSVRASGPRRHLSSRSRGPDLSGRREVRRADAREGGAGGRRGRDPLGPAPAASRTCQGHPRHGRAGLVHQCGRFEPSPRRRRQARGRSICAESSRDCRCVRLPRSSQSSWPESAMP